MKDIHDVDYWNELKWMYFPYERIFSPDGKTCVWYDDDTDTYYEPDEVRASRLEQEQADCAYKLFKFFYPRRVNNPKYTYDYVVQNMMEKLYDKRDRYNESKKQLKIKNENYDILNKLKYSECI